MSMIKVFIQYLNCVVFCVPKTAEHSLTQRVYKHIVINASDARDGIFLLFVINTVPAVALAPKVTRELAFMILTA